MRTPDEVDAHVGLKVLHARKERKVSQQALAEACGISFQQVQKYEKGANRISASRLAQIAHRLRREPGWFFPDTEKGQVQTTALTILPTLAGGIALAEAWTALSPEKRRAVLQLVVSMSEDTGAGGGS